MFFFGVQDPEDSADDLRGSDGAGEIWVLLERLHQILPGFWAVLPRAGIATRVNQSHDTVADQGHRGKVLPAAEVELHERSPVT